MSAQIVTFIPERSAINVRAILALSKVFWYGKPMTTAQVVIARTDQHARSDGPGTFRYQALVFTEGLLWSFGCNHLHHTEKAAVKCIGKVEDVWDAYHAPGFERTVIQVLPYPIIEFKITYGQQSRTKRMSPADFWEVAR